MKSDVLYKATPPTHASGMTRCVSAVVLALVVMLDTAAVHAEQPLTLAVSPFANKTGDAKFDAVSKGLADMLTTDLAVSSDLKLVERERIAAVMAELKLGRSKAFAPKTAQRVGKMLGAELMLVGAVSAWKPTLRIDARIVSVESGEVMVVASASGPQESFFAVESQLAKKLLAGFGVKLSPLQRMKIGRAATRSWKALAAYSKGLDAHDRGDKEAAKKAFQAAIAADPAFARATAALQKLGARVAALERRTDAVERAGGLILRPQSAVEYWSNHKVLLSRGHEKQAKVAAQMALRLHPQAIDALWALCLAGPNGKAEVGAATVSDARQKLVCALAGNLGIVAAEASPAMVSGTKLVSETGLAPLTAEQVAPGYLRLRAITAPANRRTDAALRAESVGLGLLLAAAIRTKEGKKALDAMFLDSEQRSAARAFVRAHVKFLLERIAPGKQLRGSLYAEVFKVALLEHSNRSGPPFLLQVRFAAKNVRAVRVSSKEKTWSLAPHKLPASAEVAMWQVALRKAPNGLSELTVSWSDDARRQHTETRKWPLRLTSSGSYRTRGEGLGATIRSRYPMLSTHLAPRASADLGGQFLVDPVVGLWTKRYPQSKKILRIQAMFAGHPSVWATGGLLDRTWPGHELTRLGLFRPLIYGTGTGVKNIRLLGGARYFRETVGRKTAFVSIAGTLSAERSLEFRPIADVPSRHVLGLVATHRRGAALQLYRRYMMGLSQSAALWELSKENGLYAALWTTCSFARSHQPKVKQLRNWVTLSGALASARLEQATWASELLAICTKNSAFAAAWQKAEATDRQSRTIPTSWRYRAEVAAARVLGGGWPTSDSPHFDKVRDALVHASASSLEIVHLISAAIAHRAGRKSVAKVQSRGSRARVPAGSPASVPVNLVKKQFWLDRDEVSTGSYAACVAAGGCRGQTDVLCAHGLGLRANFAFNSKQATHCLPVTPGILPQNYVQHSDAARYCAWRGGRLPRAKELLTAAVDNEGRAPWHETRWRGVHGNLRDRVTCAWRTFGRKSAAACGKGKTVNKLPWDRYGWIAPVGAHPMSESVHGVAHLAGNLREWVAGPGRKAFGCSFEDSPTDPSVCLRTVRAVGTYASNDVGFRCAYDQSPKARPAAVRPVRRGKIRWARIPGGTFQIGELGVRDRARSKPFLLIEAADKKAIKAVSRATAGLTQRQLRRLLKQLRTLGVTGPLSARFLEEIVARGLWKNNSSDQVIAALLEMLETFDPKPFFTACDVRVSFRRLKAMMGDDAGKIRQAMVARLQHELIERPKAPRPKTRIRWQANRALDCTNAKVGACLDSTGLSSASFGSGTHPRAAQTVKLASFQMMTTEVTQRDFAAVLKRQPSHFDCPTCAVERVTWSDADAFCRKIGARLPTEAEWSYAAAGGKTARRYGVLNDVAWFLGNRTAPRTKKNAMPKGAPPNVASKLPNAYGLYDMLGGVWEWTADRWIKASNLRPWAASLRPVEKRKIGSAPAGAKPWCIRVSRFQRYAEKRMDVLPWKRAGLRWIACYDTPAEATTAVRSMLAMPPLGPSKERFSSKKAAIRTIVGGSWASDSRLVHRLSRAPTMEQQRSVFIGFRCAK